MASRSLSEVATGAVVLLVAVGFLAYALAETGRSSFAGYRLTAKFDRIDGMSVGSDVRLAGVKVGSVASARIDPLTYLAVVTLSIDPSVRLPKDSSAEITSDGLLGGKYMALVPGGDPTMLTDGQAITITQSAVSLEQLLGKFIFSVTDMVNAAKGTDAKADPDAKSDAGAKPNAKAGARP